MKSKRRQQQQKTPIYSSGLKRASQPSPERYKSRNLTFQEITDITHVSRDSSSPLMNIIAPISDIFLLVLQNLDIQDVLALITCSKCFMTYFEKISFPKKWQLLYNECNSYTLGCSNDNVKPILLMKKRKRNNDTHPQLYKYRIVAFTDMVQQLRIYTVSDMMPFLEPLLWGLYDKTIYYNPKFLVHCKVLPSMTLEEKRLKLFQLLLLRDDIYCDQCYPNTINLPISSLFTIDDSDGRAISLMRMKSLLIRQDFGPPRYNTSITEVYYREIDDEKGEENHILYLHYITGYEIPVYILRSRGEFVDTTKISRNTLHSIYLATLYVKKKNEGVDNNNNCQ